VNRTLIISPSSLSELKSDKSLIVEYFPLTKCSVASMSHDLLSTAGSHDSDTEAVLVEAQDFSEDDTFDFESENDNDEFEDDEDDMSLVRIRLHDLNTLRHLYRFGLLSGSRSIRLSTRGNDRSAT
jgi:hypothetical protein